MSYTEKQTGNESKQLILNCRTREVNLQTARIVLGAIIYLLCLLHTSNENNERKVITNF